MTLAQLLWLNIVGFRSYNLHFDPLDLDAPGVCGFVEAVLHVVRDGLAFAEDLSQVLGAEHVS